jgi:hypothetical protein
VKTLVISSFVKIPVLNPELEVCTLLLFGFEPFDEELIDVLRLLIAEVRAEILHEFDDAMLSQVLVG